jgi:outer membrane autotransporter protein
MNFKSFTSAVLCLSTLSLAATTASVEHAQATNSAAATCAAIDPSRGGAAATVNAGFEFQVTVVSGEQITFTRSDVGTNDYSGAATGTAASGVAVVFNVSGQIDYDRIGDGSGVSASVTCSVAPTASSTSSQSLTPVIINSSDNATNSSVNNAVSGAFQPDSSSGAAYIAANSFSLSTRALPGSVNDSDSEDGFGYNGSTSEPWNLWISGDWDTYDGKDDTLDGYVANLSAGFDYKLNENVLIGILTGFSKSDIDTLLSGTNGSIKSNAYKIGVYGGAQTGGLTSSAFATFTRSDYDVVNGTTTGSFNADRYTFGFKAYGSLVYTNFTLQPTASITYSNEKQKAYIDSAANSVAANTVTSGRFSIGPKLVFNPIQSDSGQITPWAAVNFDHNFSSQDAATTGAPNLGNNSSASMEFGFVSQLDSGANISASGRVGGLGSNAYTSYGGSVKLNIPFQ